ncbi:MAG TPA: signal peptidase I [Chthoniobacterales bacterium]|jgi:signal peptidase I|nr:signal peptidase I [Chthoniobacterales bacterium]
MFTKKYVKHGQILVRHAEKLLRYRRDVLEESTLEGFKAQIDVVRKSIKDRDEARAKAESDRLHDLYMKHLPAPKDASWRENVEVVLVAVVVAIGVRSYFLQPFKIPTGSMQPTLNGIIGHRSFVANDGDIPIDQKPQYEKRSDGWYWKSYPADGAKPNILRQVAEFFILGRNYINVVADKDDVIEQILPKKYGFFFTFSQIVCQHGSYLVYAPPDTLKQDFRVSAGARYKKGDVIARGAVDTGDQVFVDKFSYNFIRPHRGDVFVFRTDNIPDIPGDPETGEHSFYIKRLAGLPGNTLRIDPPLLFVDGKLAEGFGFARVMAAKPPYHGYASGPQNRNRPDPAAILTDLSDPTKTFTVPPHNYFAMGDNSAHSFDSRWWGPVPEPNLVGRGLFVYWPFTWHWGIIR